VTRTSDIPHPVTRTSDIPHPAGKVSTCRTPRVRSVHAAPRTSLNKVVFWPRPALALSLVLALLLALL